MRLKPVPPAPDDLETVRTARRAVPLVPKPEDDCCARLQDRLDLPARDDARTWLTFLRALDLADEKRHGFARRREEFEDEALAAAFREGVFAAEEVLAELAAADEPLSADAVFGRVEGVVPRWERDRDPAWRDTWGERVARLLEWAVLLGLAEQVDDGFRAVGS